MSNTANYNLYKPSAGESGWTDSMNQNLDTIDAQLKSNADSLSNHSGTGSNKHLASQINSTLAGNVESALNILNEVKAGMNHTHSEYALLSHSHNQYALQSDLNEVNNTLDLLLPDISEVVVSASISNRSGGIRIIGMTTPNINVTAWQVQISKNGSVVFDLISAGNYVFIHEESMTGVEDGDVIEINITAISGKSLKSKIYSHQFHHLNSYVEDRLLTLENQLTIGNIIDSFAQDADALQALANVLHSSNTLAQKVAELNR